MRRYPSICFHVLLFQLLLTCASTRAQSPILAERLAARTSSGHLLAFTWSPVHDWEVEDVTAKTGQTIVGTVTSWQVPNGPYRLQHLAAEGSNGDLLNFYWSPQHDWQVVNVSQITGVKVSSGATSWQAPNGPYNVEHLAAASAAGHLVDFYWSPQHDWQAVDVSQKTGITVSIAATSWQTPNGAYNVEHLAAPSAAGHLVDFYWSSQHDWQAVDISQKTGINVSTSATSWQTSNGAYNVEHLAASSTANHLVDFYWSPQHDWQAVDVSQKTNINVSGSATSWQTKLNAYNVEHLGAANTSGHLIEFYWSPQHDWQAIDVSAGSGTNMSGAATSWQVPNGAANVEHLAIESTTGSLAVFVRSSQQSWQIVNVSGITGALVASSPSSWQIHDLPHSVAVLTQHNSNYRTGTQTSETSLTAANVALQGMQLLYPPLEVDNSVDAQPLYMRSVPFPKGSSNALFTITGSNTAYAFNADTGAPIWKTHLVDSSPQVRGTPNDWPPTPVIDADAGVMYVLISARNVKSTSFPNDFCNGLTADACKAKSQTFVNNLLAQMNVAYWLVALDLSTGKELRRVQVSALIAPTLRTRLSFDPRVQLSHTALLLDHGSIYLGFGSNAAWEGLTVYHGWVIRYDAGSFAQKGAFTTSFGLTSTDEGEGGGIWQGGGGLAADAAGNIYFLVGNAPASVAQKLYGDSFVKLTPTADSLQLAGFQTVPQAQLMLQRDLDLGSGGLIVVPGTQILIGGGKTGTLYAIDGASLSPNATSGTFSQLQAFTNTYHANGSWDFGCPRPIPLGCQDWEAGPHLHGSPIYWQNSVFDSAEKDHMKKIPFDLASKSFIPNITTGPVVATATMMPGGLSELSANGDDQSTAIIWTVMPSAGKSAVFAYSATDLHLVWQSWLPSNAQLMSHRGGPIVADSKLVLATESDSLLVYGLRPTSQPAVGQPLSLVDPSMAAMKQMEISRYPEAPHRKDSIQPPADQVPLFRVSTTQAGNIERFDGGTRSGNRWIGNDGSSVTAEAVASAPGGDPTLPPMQLFRVTATTGTGRFSHVSWIQKIDVTTSGATYVFYEAH